MRRKQKTAEIFFYRRILKKNLWTERVCNKKIFKQIVTERRLFQNQEKTAAISGIRKDKGGIGKVDLSGDKEKCEFSKPLK